MEIDSNEFDNSLVEETVGGCDGERRRAECQTIREEEGFQR